MVDAEVLYAGPVNKNQNMKDKKEEWVLGGILSFNTTMIEWCAVIWMVINRQIQGHQAHQVPTHDRWENSGHVYSL